MMDLITYRLCKVKLGKDCTFNVGGADIMLKDKWYPAAYIRDDKEGVYLVKGEELMTLCDAKLLEEQNEFKLNEWHDSIREIKIRINNIDLYEWLSTHLHQYEFGKMAAKESTTVKNHVNNSEWREHFDNGREYFYVRKRGEYEVATQVHKGAIFYIGSEDLTKFNMNVLDNFTNMDENQRYTYLKELKYIVSNLIK